jgi:hypothetical protein
MSEPVSDYICGLPFYERERLLESLELAKKCLVFDDCKEKQLYDGLCLALWKSVKIEEMK